MLTIKKFLIFWHLSKKKKYSHRLEVTLDKEKTNWKTTLRNGRNEFNKKLKYENFKRFKLRETQRIEIFNY